MQDGRNVLMKMLALQEDKEWVKKAEIAESYLLSKIAEAALRIHKGVLIRLFTGLILHTQAKAGL